MKAIKPVPGNRQTSATNEVSIMTNSIRQQTLNACLQTENMSRIAVSQFNCDKAY